ARRDLARERAFFFGVRVLRREHHVRACERAREAVEGRERRRDHDVHVLRVAHARQECLRVGDRLGGGRVHLPVRGEGRAAHQRSNAATPGSSRPCTYSSDAPPPVERWVMQSPSPSWLIAASESPPPTTLVAELSATARATAAVPPANAGISNTPIGPF